MTTAQKPQAHAHHMVADTAKAMAHELYDLLMQDNHQFGVWKNRNVGASARALETRFVNATWPGLLEQARATLASMLARPIDEGIKESIHEALVLDASLIKGRKSLSE